MKFQEKNRPFFSFSDAKFSDETAPNSGTLCSIEKLDPWLNPWDEGERRPKVSVPHLSPSGSYSGKTSEKRTLFRTRKRFRTPVTFEPLELRTPNLAETWKTTRKTFSEKVEQQALPVRKLFEFQREFFGTKISQFRTWNPNNSATGN